MGIWGQPSFDVKQALQKGLVIPASPLALTAERKLDERRQKALWRYYIAAGSGGLAIGVHTTQFAIREAGLLQPLLELADAELNRAGRDLVRIAGVCGQTSQALAEAELARRLGFHAALVSLAAMKDATEDQLVVHCREVSEIIPLIGFYLQPAVGGRVLPLAFWRRLAMIPNVIAIKIAPFNRYQTLDVVRAVAESGREDIALYTGNDDNILLDLITPYRFEVDGQMVQRRIVGGLLGHWSIWTKKAVELLSRCHDIAESGVIPPEALAAAMEITDCNAAIFDAANGFAGCIPGIHEVLRLQGLLEGIWCLDPNEHLSPGQADEIDRVRRVYRHLNDDDFVAEHLDEWLSG